MGSSHSYLQNLDTAASQPIHWMKGPLCLELDVPVNKIEKAILGKGTAGKCSAAGYTQYDYQKKMDIPLEGEVDFGVWQKSPASLQNLYGSSHSYMQNLYGSSHSYMQNLYGSSHSYMQNLATVQSVRWVKGPLCLEIDVPEGKIAKAIAAHGTQGKCSDVGYSQYDYKKKMDIPLEGEIDFDVY